MLKELIKVANKLDMIGLTKEADYIDQIVRAASKHGMPFDETPSDSDVGEYGDEDGNEPWDQLRYERTDGVVQPYAYGPEGINERDWDEETYDPAKKGPEGNFYDRMLAAKILKQMSDEEFDQIVKDHPDTMKRIFGENTLFPVYRRKKTLN